MKCSDIGKPYGLTTDQVIYIIHRLGIPLQRGRNGSDFSEYDLIRIYEELERIAELKRRGIKLSRNGTVLEGNIADIIEVRKQKPVREAKKEEPKVIQVIKETQIIRDTVKGTEEVIELPVVEKVEELLKEEVKVEEPKKITIRRKRMSKDEKEFADADEVLDEVIDEEVDDDDMEDEYEFDDDDLDDMDDEEFDDDDEDDEDDDE